MAYAILGVLVAAGIAFLVFDNRRARRARAEGRPLPNTLGGESLSPGSRKALMTTVWVALGVAVLVIAAMTILTKLGPN